MILIIQKNIRGARSINFLLLNFKLRLIEGAYEYRPVKQSVEGISRKKRRLSNRPAVPEYKNALSLDILLYGKFYLGSIRALPDASFQGDGWWKPIALHVIHFIFF